MRPVLEQVRVSSGAGPSWPAAREHRPLLAIDHVATLGRLAVCDGGTFPLPGSDHRGVYMLLGSAAAPSPR
jgi:endonuclease/exonuclease/phosphatase family metal-dependent hydrolase